MSGAQHLGSYELRARLGSGGMGTVFLARRVFPSEGEPVALKCLHPHLLDDEACREMFLDEARLQMRIDHPAFCAVRDVGTADDVPYLAMELLTGRTLADVMRAARRRPIEEVQPIFAYLFAQICDGLEALHGLIDERGDRQLAVHRDVSPSNLFVGYDGRARVLDLGVACWRDRLHVTENEGLMKGRVAYMAPELLRDARPSARTDVWSLGVVMWEALTGTRLFRASNDLETLRAVVRQPILPPSLLREGLSSAFDALILRALERAPAQRTSSMRVLGDPLRSLAGDTTDADVAAWLEARFAGEAERADGAVKNLLERTPSAEVPTPSQPTHAFGARLPRLRWASHQRRLTPTSSEVTTAHAARSQPPPRRRASRGVVPLFFALALAFVIAIGVTADLAPTPARPAVPAAADLDLTLPGAVDLDLTLPGALAASDLTTAEAPATPDAPAVEPSAVEPSAAVEARAEEPARAAEPGAIPDAVTRRPSPSSSVRRVARAAAARPRTGALLVRAGGVPAQVYVDGAARGPAPLAVRVPAGRHVVELRPVDGGRPERMRVEVVPGQALVASVRFSGGRALTPPRSGSRSR